MHPHTFYSTLFDFAKRDEVFVIISFAPEFDWRWGHVVEPAIRQELGLKAVRVDYNESGESVVYDILDGIAHSRLVLADITCSIMKDRRGQEWPQRNGNVMWELGIAHTMRLPDEVIVVRSDNEPSIFDLTQFRAFQYDPDGGPIEAQRYLAQLARDRIRSVDQSRSDYVRRCARALDPGAAAFLMRIPIDGNPVTIEPTMGNSLICPRLFELGVLSASFSTRKHPESGANVLATQATLTPLGEEVVKELCRQLGVPGALATLRSTISATAPDSASASEAAPSPDEPPRV